MTQKDVVGDYITRNMLSKIENGSAAVKGNYTYWQCAEDAKIGGIEGNVDHDIWYIDPDKVYTTYAKGKKDAVSIEDCDIKFDKDSYKLINHRAIPKVQVNYDGKKLRKGMHYEISFVRNETEGTGYAIIRGIDSYKDWMAVPFKIE